jgi:hypothetical protein
MALQSLGQFTNDVVTIDEIPENIYYTACIGIWVDELMGLKLVTPLSPTFVIMTTSSKPKIH